MPTMKLRKGSGLKKPTVKKNKGGTKQSMPKKSKSKC